MIRGSTRMRRVLPALLGVALLASSLTGCDWPERTLYVHPVYANYDVTSGIVYRQTTRWNGDPIQLRLDIYEPRGDTKAERPVMMWMFGGGWRFGDRNQLASLAQDSARRGYVAVTIDYRTRGDQDPFNLSAAELDAYDDTIAAIQWLQANAATYRIDPEAIVPAGFSAGAINALHAVWRPGTRGPTVTPAAGAVAGSGMGFLSPPAGTPAGDHVQRRRRTRSCPTPRPSGRATTPPPRATSASSSRPRAAATRSPRTSRRSRTTSSSSASSGRSATATRPCLRASERVATLRSTTTRRDPAVLG